MKKLLRTTLALLALSFQFILLQPATAQDAPDLRVNTPLVHELREALKSRFAQIKPFLETGALGVATNGSLAVRDPASVAIADRQQVSALIAANTRDLSALYREIARANGHPEWEEQIAETFTRMFREKIPAGWWIQDANGQWSQKPPAAN